MNYQRTIKKSVHLSGRGLHSGAPVEVVLKPARQHSGIHFIRTDLPNRPSIAAHFKNVTHTQLATTLGESPVSVSTVEHLMAALHGFSIDNLEVEVSGPEIPIMDGSSQAFCQAILGAGILVQDAPVQLLKIKRRVEIRIAEKWAVAEPADHFEIQASIDWDHPSIGFQEFVFHEGVSSFNEISQARTFGFLKDVEALKRMGLALGGSLENAVVLDQSRVLNPDGLRYPDEFVRHKVLDALGDFKLAGVHFLGAFKLHRAGHDLHRALLQEVFSDARNYEWVRAAEEVSHERAPYLMPARAALAG